MVKLGRQVVERKNHRKMGLWGYLSQLIIGKNTCFEWHCSLVWDLDCIKRKLSVHGIRRFLLFECGPKVTSCHVLPL